MGLTVLEHYQSVMKELQSTVDNKLSEKIDLTILEAGCGSGSWLKFKPEAKVVGIDISQKQLDRNTVLHEKILGDIQTHQLPQNAYDLIMCWDVLEHLPNPDKAIKNFFQSLKKDGIVLLAAPNVLTLRGYITKYSPHWFHIFFYKYVYHYKNAGKEDQPPFKTYHCSSMAPAAIEKLALQDNMKIIFSKKYQVQHVSKHPLIAFAWAAANSLLNILTCGKIETDKKSSFILLLQKT